jgi:hypothetical protein
MDSVNSIVRIVLIGFTLLGVGALLDVTATLRNQAAKEHMQGLFSLRKWNRALVGPSGSIYRKNTTSNLWR